MFRSLQGANGHPHVSGCHDAVARASPAAAGANLFAMQVAAAFRGSFSELLADPSVLRVGLRRRLAGEPAAWVLATAPSAVAAQAPPPPAELSDLIYVRTEADGSGQELARSR